MRTVEVVMESVPILLEERSSQRRVQIHSVRRTKKIAAKEDLRTDRNLRHFFRHADTSGRLHRSHFLEGEFDDETATNDGRPRYTLFAGRYFETVQAVLEGRLWLIKVKV